MTPPEPTAGRAGTAGDRAGLLRSIPAVDAVLASDALREARDGHSHRVVVRRVREVLDEMRRGIAAGEITDPGELSPDTAARRAAARVAERSRPYYRRVINATGVVLHTNLGRAPLPEAAVAALGEVAGHPQRVELDLASGRRGGRDEGCERLLMDLLDCEAATVVNNNAAATLLVLAALARGREVVVSRGELVEIGGSYRVPEILEESGARLREVGTTNRTHLADYEAALEAAALSEVALGEGAGMILKVHTSNYRVVGFTAEVELAELAALGRRHDVPVVHDLGSGCLVDLAGRGLPGEELVADSVASGADVVCFSGDKLLGGPQAGILVGRREAVERCRRHPLFRSLRPGRLVYAALEATLGLYLGEDDAAVAAVPALRQLLAPRRELRGRAEALAEALAPLAGLQVRVVDCESRAGSGSLPTRGYPSAGVELRAGDLSADELAGRLRAGDPPVVTRVRYGAVLLDVRTVEEAEAPLVVAAVACALSAGSGHPGVR